MSSLLSKLGTFLTLPEDDIFKQGDDSLEMFYIIQGDCVMNITEHDLVTRNAVRLLVEGDHIGEIGLLYNCKRTASIVSRNYNVMARLGLHRFREL
jgi:CRP-like cAMP-binding protein